VAAVTSGNHLFHREDAVALLGDPAKRLLRPYNMTGKDVPGRGWCVVGEGGMRLAVANLIGITQFRPHTYANPFLLADALLGEIAHEAPDAPIVLDFHAEATSEKKAMGWMLDGKVAAVIGTHTHVPTRDERLLPKGTAYITDVGMVGPFDSVLGLEPQPIIENFTREPKAAIDIAEGPVEVNAVLIEIPPGRLVADSITHLREIIF
jgi:metallophosphoesterase (TIGR00282 family)